MRTASYTDLKNNLKGFLDGVVTDCEPLVVHRVANTSVVIVSIDEWNSLSKINEAKTETVFKEEKPNKRNDASARNFVSRWAGFLKDKNIDPDAAKYEYLTEKYK